MLFLSLKILIYYLVIKNLYKDFILLKKLYLLLNKFRLLIKRTLQ